MTSVPAVKANEVLDPGTNTWSRATNMSILRMDFGLVAVHDLIYAIGGFNIINNNGYVSPSEDNKQYVPIGYSEPQPEPDGNIETPEASFSESPNQSLILQPMLLLLCIILGVIGIGVLLWVYIKKRVRAKG